jgi:hypothetical protein
MECTNTSAATREYIAGRERPRTSCHAKKKQGELKPFVTNESVARVPDIPVRTARDGLIPADRAGALGPS